MTLREQAIQMAEYLQQFMASLQPLSLPDLVRDADGADKIAIFSVDVINGFCHEGALASPRVGTIVQPIVQLFTRLYEIGVRHFILLQDAHSENTPEFRAWPPHCVRGTNESETVPELAALPFSKEFILMPKNSISSAIGTELENWLHQHPEITRAIVVGDVTDLCTANLALYLRFHANAYNIQEREVIVPTDCVQTYDLPFETAQQIGVFPHPGDLLHALFLYHMALNRVQIVERIK